MGAPKEPRWEYDWFRVPQELPPGWEPFQWVLHKDDRYTTEVIWAKRLKLEGEE